MFASLCASLLAALGDLLAPRRCALCDELSATSLCPACEEALAAPPPARKIDGVPLLAAHPYAEPVRGAIGRLKYQGRVDVVPTLARLAAARIELSPLGPELLMVPVPLHVSRLAERGFNQSALLASALVREWRKTSPTAALRVAARALERSRATGHQARRGRQERLSALAHAVIVATPARVAGRRVVLCDDVVTTGATASACIAALRGAGAEVAAVMAVCSATVATRDDPQR